MVLADFPKSDYSTTSTMGNRPPSNIRNGFGEGKLREKDGISGWGPPLGSPCSGNVWAGKTFSPSCWPLHLSKLAGLL